MLITLVDYGFKALWVVLLLHVIFSWVRMPPGNPLVKFIDGIADALLMPIRAVLPPVGPMDLSPMVALLILSLIQRLLHNALSGGF